MPPVFSELLAAAVSILGLSRALVSGSGLRQHASGACSALVAAGGVVRGRRMRGRGRGQEAKEESKLSFLKIGVFAALPASSSGRDRLLAFFEFALGVRASDTEPRGRVLLPRNRRLSLW